MPLGVNKVTLIGLLGREPESRSTHSGSPVVTLRIGTSETIPGRDGAPARTLTEWHRVTAFSRVAEAAARLSMGMQVYVEGSIRTHKWQDKEGRDRYTTEVVARELLVTAGAATEAPPTLTEDEIPW